VSVEKNFYALKRNMRMSKANINRNFVNVKLFVFVQVLKKDEEFSEIKIFRDVSTSGHTVIRIMCNFCN
jgi:hypothetical protein